MAGPIDKVCKRQGSVEGLLRLILILEPCKNAISIFLIPQDLKCLPAGTVDIRSKYRAKQTGGSEHDSVCGRPNA